LYLIGVTDSEHTTTKLARALEAIPGVPADMIKRAREGFYHDFLSPLDFPEMQLVADLKELASRPATPRNSRPLLRQLAQDVRDGKHDASKAESDAWAASPEGQETMAALTGQSPGPPTDAADAVKACADLVGRTGARQFECGYISDNPPHRWYATAVFKGAKITAEDKESPAEACDKLAARLLTGAQCQHCKKLVTLSPLGAMARDATLIDGREWTAEQQKAAGLCHWTRPGDKWVRGCVGAGEAARVASALECPCGEAHPLSEQTRVAYDNVTAGLPATVLVASGGRSWQVPRIYIAAHGLRAADLPELAERYGFEEGRPR
jgi:hypothetical protein